MRAVTGIVNRFKKSDGAHRRKARANASSSARPNVCPRVDVSTAQKHVIVGRKKRRCKSRQINRSTTKEEPGY